MKWIIVLGLAFWFGVIVPWARDSHYKRSANLAEFRYECPACGTFHNGGPELYHQNCEICTTFDNRSPYCSNCRRRSE